MIIFGLLLLCGTSLGYPTFPDSSDPGPIFVPLQGYDIPSLPSVFKEQAATGTYHFGFSHAGQVRSETKDAEGNVVGYYSYLRHTGEPTIVFYNADKTGFKVSSNDLPVAIRADDPSIPVSVQDTPAVAVAKKQFFDAYKKIFERDQLNQAAGSS